MSVTPATNQKNKYGLVEDVLLQPVPNMDDLRERKKDYNELPIDTTHPLFNEPVVNIADYGIAGQSYYSRPNPTTVQPVPGTLATMYLRKSVAEILATINAALQHPKITDFFAGPVELYVEDALRTVSLQRRLHDILVPALLHKNQPQMTDEEIAARVKDIIAIPSSDRLRPSPHATGGVVDVVLRYKQPGLGYAAGCNVIMGHAESETGLRINPDYFETHTPQTEEEKTAQKHRRAYYAIMTGSAFGINTGLVNNPTEWWHWGIGDQLSAKVHGDKAAYYSLASE